MDARKQNRAGMPDSLIQSSLTLPHKRAPPKREAFASETTFCECAERLSVLPKNDQYKGAIQVERSKLNTSSQSVKRLQTNAWVLMGMLTLAFISLAASRTASAVTQTSAISCTSCQSLADLQASATTYFQGNYFQSGIYQIGAIVLVSSVNYPISAFFSEQWGYSCIAYFGCGTHLVAQAITPDNASTAILDNNIYSRAAKIQPINISPSLSSGETDELISAFITSQIQVVGPPQLSVWHGLLNYPQFVSYKVLDLQTGQTTTIWVGDTITVRYSNGDTEQWKYVGPETGVGVQWQRVYGTLKDPSGHPIPAVTQTGPATPVNSGINFTVPVNWSVNVQPPANYCTAAAASVCIGDPGGNDWSCSSSYIIFPC